MFKTIDRNGRQQTESGGTPCMMEPMEDRLLMASDYLRPGGYEPATVGATVTFTYTVTNPAPTTGILIGLLLPAVQKAPG